MNENMKNRLIRIIECPNCYSKNFHYRDVDKHNMDNGILWGLYCCNDCGTDFDVEYIANDICFADTDESKNNIIKLQF